MGRREWAGVSEHARYRFGPLEQRGLVAGWRGGQILSVACGLVVAVGIVRQGTTAVHMALALCAVGLATVLAVWPVGGRTGEQWLPVVAAWLWRRASGRDRWRSSLPVAGSVQRGRLSAEDATARGPFSGCCIVSVPFRGTDAREATRVGAHARAGTRSTRGAGLDAGAGAEAGKVGVLFDRKARTLTAVLALRGSGFPLLAPDDQDAAVAGWAGVLASLAHEGTGVHRLQWIERTLPDDARALRRYRDSHATVQDTRPAARSYEEVLRACCDGSNRHETLLAVTVRERRPGGRHGPETPTALMRELRMLASQLRGTGLAVDGVLSPGALATAIRRAAEPEAPEPPDPASPDVHAWPVATEAGWSEMRTDATFHAVYWIAEWPRSDVGPDFLAPLLLRQGIRRTVAVTMEPVSPLRAQREAENARVADMADRRLRQRNGFLVSARRRREEEGVSRRELELADGHGQFRFTGYVAVTADSLDGLADARRSIEDAAGQARLVLRLLYGDQERAFASILPLGRGLA